MISPTGQKAASAVDFCELELDGVSEISEILME